MKITMLSNSKGGVFTATMQLARGLARKGHDINIFFLTESEEATRISSSAHIQLNYLTTNFLPNLRALIGFLFRDSPDIIHINFVSFGPLAIFKKYVFKVPYVCTLHGLPQPWLEPSLIYKIAYSIEHCLLRFVILRSSATATVSKYVQDMLKKRYGLYSGMIYQGIDPKKLKNKIKTRNKNKLNYRKDDFIILFVARMHPYKDPLTLIKSVSIVIKKNPNLSLVMIGNGELYQKAREEVSKLGLSACVKLLRRVSDDKLKAFYNAADLFVLTSINEAFGITLLEAMASGLPIIASNSGACPEVVGDAGILFSYGNHVDLAEKIIDLLNNPSLQKKLRKNGLRRVSELFSLDEMVNQYLNLYKKVNRQS